MDEGDAETAVLLGNGRGEVAMIGKRGEALERIRPGAVVIDRMGCEIVSETLGQAREAGADLGLGSKLETQPRPFDQPHLCAGGIRPRRGSARLNRW